MSSKPLTAALTKGKVMSNTIKNFDNSNFGSPIGEITPTVLKNDTSTYLPSIKLDAMEVPVTVSVEAYSSAPKDQISLIAMEKARMSWETTELAASNKRLYSILRDAYSYYKAMKQDHNKGVREDRKNELNKFIATRAYTFMPSTHDMTRVVKCVFGVDRRRVSAYSIALREALRQEIEAKDLIAFIDGNGGVEQIRMGGSKPLSVTKRAAKAADEVLGNDLGMLKFDAKLLAADADWADKQVVIVATYLPTGEFQANAVIRHDSAVNAALAAYYSQQQAKLREVAKAEREAEEAAAKSANAAEVKLQKQAQEKQRQINAAFEQAASTSLSTAVFELA